MGGTSDKRREERAFDALIISQLRRERDITSLDDLPQLTEEELAAMNEIPADIIEKLWAEESKKVSDEDSESELDDDLVLAGAGAGDEVYSGFDRAEGKEDEDEETLDEARGEVLDELSESDKKRTKDGDGEHA